MATMKEVFGFDVERAEEMALLAAALDEMGRLIRERLVHPSVACEIFDAHVAGDAEHSCLGCNLSDAVEELGLFLSADIAPASELTRLHLALELTNVVWERISDVSRAVKLPGKLWSESELKFPAFKKARQWANFMKHPGFFGMGIHHPIYVVDGSAGADTGVLVDGKRSKTDKTWVLIDDEFVRANWSGDHTGESARKELAEPFTACVVLPDVATLAAGLCGEFIEFVNRMKEPTWVELAREFVVCEADCDWW